MATFIGNGKVMLLDGSIITTQEWQDYLNGL